MLVTASDHEPTPGPDAHARVADAFREEYARVVASVLRMVRDIDLAEEIVQEAFEQALDRWPITGTPDRPGGWLLTTARRRAIDVFAVRAAQEPGPRPSPTRPRSARATRFRT